MPTFMEVRHPEWLSAVSDAQLTIFTLATPFVSILTSRFSTGVYLTFKGLGAGLNIAVVIMGT